MADGFRQLAAYSIPFALESEQSVAVQPFFLRRGEKWEPRVVTREAVQAAKEAIVDHHVKEKELVERVSVPSGRYGYEKSVWRARREDFPAKPRKPFCALCNFRFVCDEGKAELKKTVPTVAPAAEVSLA